MLSVIASIFKYNSGFDKIRYLFKGTIWAIRKRRGDKFVTKLWNNALVQVYPSTSYSSIFYRKYSEPTDMIFLRNNASLSDTLIDVGANVGLFSMTCCNDFKKIVLFEPSPETFKALQDTLVLNVDCLAEFESHNIGVSDKKGSLSFIAEPNLSPTSRVAKDYEKGIEVPVDTLDSVLNDRFESVVLKVDVEGHEENVFAGAEKLFSKKIVKLLMFERLGRTNLENVLEFMLKHDYTVFRILDDGSISTNSELVAEPLINLFTCPSEVFPTLKS